MQKILALALSMGAINSVKLLHLQVTVLIVPKEDFI